jgi:hypothetical protein
MRRTIRVLALASLALFGLGTLFATWPDLQDPCPEHVGAGILALVPSVFLALAVFLALIGSIVAAILAFTRRRWGWLAGLLVGAIPSLIYVADITLFHSALEPVVYSVVVFYIIRLVQLFYYAGLACGPEAASPLAFDLSILVVPLPTLLVLLIYGFSRAADVSSPPASNPMNNPG